MRLKSMRFFVSILFPVSRMESEGTILQCASNYMKESNHSLLSQLPEKVSTKLDSARKVKQADMLVKLGQKGFPNRDFQSEAYISSSISTDAEGEEIYSFKISGCYSS